RSTPSWSVSRSASGARSTSRPASSTRKNSSSTPTVSPSVDTPTSGVCRGIVSGIHIVTGSHGKGALVDDSSYAMFLILGTALVFADGQIIYRSGLRYLANSFGDNRGSSRSMARLVSVLFHLAMLGILALIST